MQHLVINFCIKQNFFLFLDVEGRTAFLIAFEYDHSKVVEEFLQKSVEFDIDINAKDKLFGCTGD